MINSYSTQRQTIDPWIGTFRPGLQTNLTLFCFPYAGGSSLIYKNWQALLPPSISVCAVQLPGRGMRLQEPAFTSIFPMVDALGEALSAHLVERFAFFGHSMGARISFELARLLRRQGRPLPVHIFASGSRAPQITDDDPPTYNLPEPEFIDELSRLAGTPQEVLEHPELMQLMIPLLRADFEVCQTYVAPEEPPLSCPITAFGGLQDVDIPRENIAAWQAQTSGKFTHRMLPGGHFFLHEHERMIIQSVARELLTSLAS
jgi:medium-chain acyl-[acyl-carrier-protein] hydrolase